MSRSFDALDGVYCDRRSFLRGVGAAAATALIGGASRSASAHPAGSPGYREARAFLESHFVVDLHAHPSLKTGFFKKDFYAAHAAPPNTWPFTLRTDAPSLAAGGVNAVCSAIYVPEPQIVDDARVLAAAGSLSPSIRRMKKSLDRDPAAVAFELLDRFEENLASDSGARVARSVDELDRIAAEGKIAILHTLEGGHVLIDDSSAPRIDVLDKLHTRGVCMITLAHFYDAGVAPNIQGVPKNWYLRALGCFKDQYASELDQSRLPEAGRVCVEAMLERGILADLTHMTPEARADVCDITAGRAPLVMSHVGCFEEAPFRMNPNPDEVRRIADTGGIIGVIFLNYFLKGKQRGKGIDAILHTMQCLIDHGGEDSVAWASDFDGFTNPPNDLTEHADLPRLAARMLDTFGETATVKILGGNVRRVLAEGWKSPGSAPL